jgi:hypothetical protein
MQSSEILCGVALIRTSVSMEHIASMIESTTIGEVCSMFHLLVTVNVAPSLPFLVTMMMEAIHFSKTYKSHMV